MTDDSLLGNRRTFPFSQSLSMPPPHSEPVSQDGECELLGIFGWFVQLTLALLSIGSLTGKSFKVSEF